MVFCLVLVGLNDAFLQLEGFCKSFYCTTNMRKKQGRKTAFQTEIPIARPTSKLQRQAQWLKILLVPFSCTFVKNLRHELLNRFILRRNPSGN